ncbi:hypothetical protein CCR97_18950 [Rhodoplanes elegans]|uniref:Helix-turn-helix domain-containing protein n=1 Tax=Rhodoplanes elegans TaxID=29408 RepID=A0A327KQK1_9BRAD|nr:hypothetical protein [Rhodoplanes elegans]MBK5960263.1 hypothetical protein [Rhodoplanes elegans]RAI40711.1 hypothetical protein CH338_05335 [Rhodoplanes elegans]
MSSKAGRKEFTREVFAWLGRICADRSLPAAAFRLAFAISQYFNFETCTSEAWPGQATLATAIGSDDPRNVRRLAGQLVAAGYLSIEEHRGRHQTNVYRMENRTALPGFSGQKTGQQRPVIRRENRTAVAEKPDNPGRKTGQNPPENRTGLSYNLSNELPKELPKELSNSARERARRDDHDGELFADQIEQLATGRPTSAKRRTKQAGDGQTDEAFAEFWSIYPRHIAKANAARAFTAALKAGTDPGEIIAGAQRYAAERAGQEERYTAHPATWIRGQRWLDDPTPRGGRQHGHRPDRAAGVMAALDIAAGGFGGDDDGF